MNVPTVFGMLVTPEAIRVYQRNGAETPALVSLLPTGPVIAAYDPDGRRDDQPGDALWELAAKFREEGNRPASDATLSYLVKQYPSDRHAAAAKEMLAGHSASTPEPVGDAGK